MIVLGCLLAPTSALPYDSATGVVKERMEMMKSMAAQMKALNAMVRNKGPMDSAALRKAARTLREHGAMLPKMFPEGSNRPPTEAKPEIWREPEKFQVLWADLNEKAAALSLAGESADRGDLAKAFRGVGRICSACHKTYRSKKR